MQQVELLCLKTPWYPAYLVTGLGSRDAPLLDYMCLSSILMKQNILE